jgi:hypothetical protein
MTFLTNADVVEKASSPYVWVTAALVAIIYYTSRPQESVYGSFDRAGGTVFRWTAVHDVVADAYKTVCL